MKLSLLLIFVLLAVNSRQAAERPSLEIDSVAGSVHLKRHLQQGSAERVLQFSVDGRTDLSANKPMDIQPTKFSGFDDASFQHVTNDSHSSHPPADLPVCQNQLAFHLRLKKKGVSFSDKPQFGQPKCGEEWHKHGSCCQLDSLLRYIKRDSGNIEEYQNIMKTEVMKAKTSLSSFLNSNIKLKYGRLKRKKRKAAKKIKGHLPGWKSDMQMLVVFIDSIADRFSEVQTKCGQKMNELRTNSLCSTCSGRSPVYFSGNRAILSLRTCSDFIDQCYDAWTMLIRLTNGLVHGKQIVDNVRKLNKGIIYPYHGDAIRRMVKWMKDLKLEQALVSCQGSAQKCTPMVKKFICENTLSLEKSTYLEDSVEFLRLGRRNVKPIEIKELKNISNKTDSKKKIHKVLKPSANIARVFKKTGGIFKKAGKKSRKRRRKLLMEEKQSDRPPIPRQLFSFNPGSFDLPQFTSIHTEPPKIDAINKYLPADPSLSNLKDPFTRLRGGISISDVVVVPLMMNIGQKLTMNM